VAETPIRGRWTIEANGPDGVVEHFYAETSSTAVALGVWRLVALAVLVPPLTPRRPARDPGGTPSPGAHDGTLNEMPPEERHA
jgi:hypothetical protein